MQSQQITNSSEPPSQPSNWDAFFTFTWTLSSSKIEKGMRKLFQPGQKQLWLGYKLKESLPQPSFIIFQSLSFVKFLLPSLQCSWLSGAQGDLVNMQKEEEETKGNLLCPPRLLLTRLRLALYIFWPKTWMGRLPLDVSALFFFWNIVQKQPFFNAYIALNC